MSKSVKKTVYILCFIAAVLIVSGCILSINELIEEERLLNPGEDAQYYKAVFNLNGASKIDHKSIKCIVDDGSCEVVLPAASKTEGTVLGYSDNKNDIEAKYQIGDTITLSSDIELYAISYKTYTLKIEENGVDYLEKQSVSCNVYNEEKGCLVAIPRYNKVGYENKGYSTSIESLTGFIYPGEEYSISKDLIIYPIYSTSSRNKVLNINKTFTYQNSFIEVENGCKQSVYNKLLEYLDGIKKHVPFLLLGNKITFVTDKSFDTIWGVNYVGMNFGPKSLRSVDIRCSDAVYNDYYATMVHEMAHSWDFYYAAKLGDNISNQSDIINLYNKYKEKKDRPFRDYSYSSIYEFVADMMRYYYFKYYEPKSGFSELNYPSDIKKALEKYICISLNDYNDSQCK